MNRVKVILIAISTWATFAFAQQLHTKIVNGTLAAPGEFPFAVSLRSSRTARHFCGGSLVDSHWVLTAAHCVSRTQANDMNVQYGSNELQRNATSVAKLTKIYVHEGYIGANNTFRDDIALLRLSEDIKMGQNVTTVRLPKRSLVVPNGTPAVLIGWGYNATGGTVQSHLQKVDLQIFDFLRCSIRHVKPLPTTTICAGVPEGWKGQCSGDSGGPLLVNGTQVGIVSWSVKPCARPPYPGVFTKVSSYTDWMNRIMSDDAEGKDILKK